MGVEIHRYTIGDYNTVGYTIGGSNRVCQKHETRLRGLWRCALMKSTEMDFAYLLIANLFAVHNAGCGGVR